MSGLFASFSATSQSLVAFERALEITQNNVNNASTPGYAAQIADFSSLSFGNDAAGGVTSSSVSTRDTQLDAAVRTQLTGLGSAQQQVNSLSSIEPQFDVTGKTGVPGSLTQLFTSFSSLSVTPSSTAAREAVLSAAKNVASAFNQAASALSQSAATASRGVEQQLSQVNTLAKEIQGYNVTRSTSAAQDAGLDSKLNAALEKLSALVNVTTRPGVSGTTDVLIDGQIPLVLGNQQFSLTSATAPTPVPAPAYPAGTPSLQILRGDGQDITSHITGGSISGLLTFRNTTVPQLIGSQDSAGGLNTLAQSFADRVNSLLTSGVVSQGPPQQPGAAIFSYNTTDATQVAGSLSVVSGFTSSQIATIAPGPPAVSNGIALSLAILGQGTSASDTINGASYNEYFGNLAGGVGRQLASQKNTVEASQQAANQANSIRSQVSGVSLDAEAVRLTEYQKAYGASAKLITVLDQITQSTLDILR